MMSLLKNISGWFWGLIANPFGDDGPGNEVENTLRAGQHQATEHEEEPQQGDADVELISDPRENAAEPVIGHVPHQGAFHRQYRH